MEGQVVVISNAHGIAARDHKIFVDAALEAGAKRFSPREDGPYTRYGKCRKPPDKTLR
jgi:cytidylate kinase